MSKTDTKRRIITECVDHESPYSFEGKLSNVYEFVKGLLEQYGPDARLGWDPNYYYDYESSPTPRYSIDIDRLETDEEFQKRLDRQEIADKVQQEKELEDLRRLQEKYGKL